MPQEHWTSESDHNLTNFDDIADVHILHMSLVFFMLWQRQL